MLRASRINLSIRRTRMSSVTERISVPENQSSGEMS